MEEVIRKADVLIEALPYIKAFYGKIVVIKYGGSAISNEEIRKKVLEDIVFMSYVGMKPVLVHGGGPFISQRMRELGKKIEFINGFRVTDRETMEVVKQTLEKLNTEIVNQIKLLGGRASSLGSKRDSIIKVKPHTASRRLGMVGEIVSVNTPPISKLLRTNTIPIILPLGKGEKDEIYNVNADETSSQIASALNAEKLILLTDVKGIMRDESDVNSLFPTLSVKEAKDLLKRSIIQEGMIPKVKAAITALKKGVKKTHIIDYKIPHALLLEIFTDKGIGTEIIK